MHRFPPLRVSEHPRASVLTRSGCPAQCKQKREALRPGGGKYLHHGGGIFVVQAPPSRAIVQWAQVLGVTAHDAT